MGYYLAPLPGLTVRRGRSPYGPSHCYNRHVKGPILAAFVGAACLLTGCAGGGPAQKTEVQEFLKMYDEVSQRVGTVAAEAEWQAATDVTDEHTGQRIGAQRAAAAFTGSRYVIEDSRRFLRLKDSLAISSSASWTRSS
jgi:hypothetical protein